MQEFNLKLLCGARGHLPVRQGNVGLVHKVIRIRYLYTNNIHFIHWEISNTCIFISLVDYIGMQEHFEA